MKILHVSDFHSTKRFYSWVLDGLRSVHYDAFVLSGDLLNLFEAATITEQVKSVSDWVANLPKNLPTFLVSGNHDKLEEHLLLKHARWLNALKRDNLFIDGESTTLEGWCFECVGWGEVPIEQTSLPRIIISHSPPSPALTGLDSHGIDYGDADLSGQILLFNGPKQIVLCGHVHRPRSWHNRGAIISLNPGSNLDRKVPNHIIINTTKGVATRHTETSCTSIKL